jgi:hypothetical protein
MVHLFRQTVGDIANLYWPASRLPSFSLPWQDKYFAQKNLLPERYMEEGKMNILSLAQNACLLSNFINRFFLYHLALYSKV